MAMSLQLAVSSSENGGSPRNHHPFVNDGIFPHKASILGVPPFMETATWVTKPILMFHGRNHWSSGFCLFRVLFHILRKNVFVGVQEQPRHRPKR